MKTYIRNTIIPVIAMLLGLASCTDDLLDFDDTNIADGETELVATVGFQKFIPALDGDGTRAAGNAIEHIKSLWVVIYEKKDDPDRPWMLEEGGKIQITEQANSLVIKEKDTSKPTSDSNTETATFRLRHKNGTFKIYAVANYDLSDIKDNLLETPEDLKNQFLVWDEGNVSNNDEMFGYFGNDEGDSANETVTVKPGNKMHSWLVRAASKVTIAFDGTNLLDGIYIYPIEATIHDIPATCRLGAPNTAGEGQLIPEGKDSEKYPNIIRYPEDPKNIPNPNELDGQTPGIIKRGTEPDDEKLHSETSGALFFYENMQGVHKDKPKHQSVRPGGTDGTDLEYRDKDNVPAGTYIEVTAFYRSTKSKPTTKPGYEEPTSGYITYRFMLGKNVDDDYDAERNHHYKLTLKFNQYANDYDWHIDYRDPVLEVTDPKVFNYQGKVFVPDYTYPNLGNNFSADNEVTVTSFETDKSGQFVMPDISFCETENGTYGNAPDWLTYEFKEGYYSFENKLIFHAKAQDPVQVNIEKTLKAKPPRGSASAPYNLANPGQMVSPAGATIKCTANCYMIDRPGYYMLPLVYGNAFHNGGVKTESYMHTNAAGEADTNDKFLSVFRNYLGKEISSPYIRTDINYHDNSKKLEKGSAYLVWEDEPNLVYYSRYVMAHHENGEWADKQLRYDRTAYNGNGGIIFFVPQESFKEGNAVIAIGDKFNPGEPEKHTYKDNLPDIWWSWHIWMTTMDCFEEKDRNIEVTGHDPNRKFQVLPVNLGWCSGGKDINYFKERSYWVKLKNGEREVKIKIEQKSHIAFPMGDNLYYQWGRKDPFFGADPVGTLIDEENGTMSYNKKRYYETDGDKDVYDPPTIDTNVYPYPPDSRHTTKKAIEKGLLIKKPYAWHNPTIEWAPPLPGSGTSDWQYISKNEIWSNLWEGRPGLDPSLTSMKTIYDPCPVGYQVPHANFASGTTATGGDFQGSETQEMYWNDVLERNAYPGNPWEGVHEFYTNTDKVQSIVYPETGYRDFAFYGGVLKLGFIGYLWMGGNVYNNDDYYYSFEFSRKDKDQKNMSYVRPKHVFFPCDGFPVRPVVYQKH